MSLSDYLLKEIREVAERPTIEELRARLARRSRVEPGESTCRRGPCHTWAVVVVIVADASALIDVLLRRLGADAIEARLFDSGLTLHVPHLLDVRGGACAPPVCGGR